MSGITDFSNGLTEAVQKGGAGTVLVDARRRYPASGITYSADLVLTADHVVTREENLNIIDADGNSYPVSIAGRDPGSDLALLRLSTKSLKLANIAQDDPKVGQLVLALGRPSNTGIQASWGIITAIGGPARTGRGGVLDQYIQTETTSYPGFSGGPLVNTEGQVLGLNTSGLGHTSALTIPIKGAWRIADSLAKFGTVKRGYLGVRTQSVDVSEEAQKGLKDKQQHGLLVLWLEDKGPAEMGGLLVGDILLAVDGQSVEDPDDLFSALNTDSVGKTIPVQTLRGGKPVVVNVTVGERK
jgi:S1-C subfamily serine protease